MATIVGGIATSHTPTIGFALDANKQNDPLWAPIFAGYEPVRAWLADRKPDVLVMIYNDHITSFFFDHYSQFALGVGDRYWPADEGGGPRALPPIAGHPALAQHIATSLVADEFDLAYFQGKGLDHGCFSPLSVLWPPSTGSKAKASSNRGWGSRRRSVAAAGASSMGCGRRAWPRSVNRTGP